MSRDRSDDAEFADDARPPAGSHAHPESLPVGDWLPPASLDAEEPEVLPLDDADLVDVTDLPPAEATTGESSVIGLVPVEELPADPPLAAAELPPVAPASGWLDSGVNMGRAAAPAPVPDHEQSDIFSGAGVAPGESDVIRSLSEPPPGESDVFTGTAGSSRFEDPRDATDHGNGPPSGIIRRGGLPFDEDDTEAAAWDALKDDAPAAPPEPSAEGEGRVDFNQLDHGGSGSALFADSSIAEMFGQSGVNLGDPDADFAQMSMSGPGSSIFDAEALRALDSAPSAPVSGTEDAAVELFEDASGGAGNSTIFRAPAGGGSTVPDAALIDEDDHVDGELPEPTEDSAAAVLSASDEWESDDPGTAIDVAAESLASIDLGPEPDENELGAFAEAADTDATDATGLVGGTAVAAAAAAPRPAPKKLPLDSGRIKAAKLPLDGGDALADEDDAPRTTRRPAAAGRSGGGGWFGGGVAGLALGVGACAAAYFGGLVPQGEPAKPAVTAPPSVQPSAQQPAVAAAAPLADPQALLAGDPATALKSLESAGADAAPAVKAARGQARWQARVRELAATNAAVKADDEQLTLAAADLQAVVDAAGDAKTPAETAAAVKAALHLGLLKELSGDITGATAVYTDAAAKFPASRNVFTVAVNRLRVTNPPRKSAHLTPRQAEDLARAAAVALVLLQADAKAPPAVVDEPGFLFWEAVNHAAAEDYRSAQAAIAKARQAHDRRRLQLVGRGLNPLSDPLEQIFLQSCTELTAFWDLKRDVYGHPTFGPLARKDGVTKSVDNLVAVRKTAGDLSARVAVVTKEANDAKAAVARLTKEGETAAQQLADETKAKDAAVKLAADTAKELTDAQARADAAAAKLKTAEATLGAVVKELKTAKLVGESDDAAAVLAKLPAVMKQAATAANSADAKKAAEALAAVQKDLDAALAESAKAKADLTAATAAADKAKIDADKAVAAAKADATKAVTAAKAEATTALASVAGEVKKATAAAQAAAQKQLDDLAAAAKRAQADAAAAKTATDAKLAAAQADFAAKLAARDEQARRDVLAARSGTEVPLTPSDLAAKDRAARDFTRGTEAFFAGRYADAERLLTAATKADEADARYWYYLGLSQLMQGKETAAAFQAGAKWEAQNLPLPRQVNAALERVQGTARAELNKHRP